MALRMPQVPEGPIREFFEELHRLHIHAGEPSTRLLASKISGGFSHTTVHGVFTKPTVPGWGLLELIVEELGGDVEKFRALRTHARHAEIAPARTETGRILTEAAEAKIRHAAEEQAGKVIATSELTAGNDHEQTRRKLASARLRQSVSTMYIHLSRRSRALVERQIHLSEALMRIEQDRHRRAELFKLHHLALRMRRNDENLLVLAGADAEYRSTPTPLADLLRAATVEIEQVTRVKIGNVDKGIEVPPKAANDIVHLIAELLENATVFSRPGTDVILWAGAHQREVIIQIRDEGIGMTPEELNKVNERLAKPPAFDDTVDPRMGLLLVGLLASRHNIAVTLQTSPGSIGVLATVTVPTSVATVRHHAEQGAPLWLFTNEDRALVSQLRAAFQPRQFGAGYDPEQVQRLFNTIDAALHGLDPGQFSESDLTPVLRQVQGGYFQDEVDHALREVRELFEGRRRPSPT